MIIRYFNNQSKRDPMNGKAIANSSALARLLDER
jgi:hypothetical protein